jgi:hypothetical protein
MCSGMLSIARRKTGTEVECPKCGYEVTVPEADAEPEPRRVAVAPRSEVGEKPVPKPQVTPDRPLFEQSDFDRLLDAKIKKAAEAAAPPPPASGPMVEAETEEDGIHVNRGTLIVLAVVAVVLVVLAFAVGFLVGS